ncbi:MAG: GerMN domain-containing protein [Candidatus Hydrogenedentes bacterium]|nr:GerMN domain-containing protein [Candidatus Hydrogenedentota bacterium]
MNTADRNAVFRRFFVVLWGLATLLLVFIVALLVYQMVREGKAPLAVTVEEAPIAPPEPAMAEAVQTRDVQLYFSNNESDALVAESRPVDYGPSTIENCRATLNGLVTGPRNPLAPIVPPDTKIRALYLLEEGELVVDLSHEVLALPKGVASEALMVYGIVNTLTQSALKGPKDAGVRSVRILVEGAGAEESLSNHLDWSEPWTPNYGWTTEPQSGAASP